jgi:hypothetical protein
MRSHHRPTAAAAQGDLSIGFEYLAALTGINCRGCKANKPFPSVGKLPLGCEEIGPADEAKKKPWPKWTVRCGARLASRKSLAGTV